MDSTDSLGGRGSGLDGFIALLTDTCVMAIKPSYIKNIATRLLERYPEAFSDDFDHNKDSVSELTNIESKEVRNRVAGYVTRKHSAPPA